MKLPSVAQIQAEADAAANPSTDPSADADADDLESRLRAVSLHDDDDANPSTDPGNGFQEAQSRALDKSESRMIGLSQSLLPPTKDEGPKKLQESGSGGKEQEERAWFYASDTTVRRVTAAEVAAAEAYILLYERM